MKLNSLKPAPGSKANRHRVGRGGGLGSPGARAAKVILPGKLERKVSLKEILVRKGARAMIEAAGGSIHITEKPKVEKKVKEKKVKKSEPAEQPAEKDAKKS